MIESIQLCFRHSVKVKGPSTIRFEPGINILVGPNGSGKSTILHALHSCERCDKTGDAKGTVHYFNSETMNPHTRSGPAGDMIKILLRTRGMFSSHGEIMKVALAALPVREGDVVLVDEPEAGLDLAGVRQVRRGFALLEAARVQVIVATHHPVFLEAGRVVEMEDGYADFLRAELCRSLGCGGSGGKTPAPR